MVAGLLARSSWRFYQQHPLQLLLSVLGIMLGIGIVTAVLITNHSSQRAFALSTEALYGKATHQIQGASGIRDNFYADLRQAFPGITAAPVVEGFVAINGDVFSLIGIDPFAETPFNRAANAIGNPAATNSSTFDTSVIIDTGLLISASSNQRLQLAIGEPFQLQSSDTLHTLKLLAEFDTSNPAAGEGLLVGDIALVQQILNRGSAIDRIDLILPDKLIEKVRQFLPATLKVSDAVSRRQTMQAMTRGFQINLTAMSLLSLVVGAFLIHNTMTFAVLQRRELFAVKRITGMSARAIWLNIVCEALLISFFGSVLGLLLGILLAHGLIKLTTQTINDLYFVLHVQSIHFNWVLTVAALILGMGTSLLAASIAATDAAKTDPTRARMRSIKEQQTQRWLPLLAAGGFVLSIIGIGLSLLPTPSLILGFLALMFVIVGYGLCLPWLSFITGLIISRLLSGTNTIIAMAAGSISRNISRTGLAIAALSVAVSSTFGVNVMIGSFRDSVDNWLGNTLLSDAYISAPASVSSRASTALDASILQAVQSVEGIKSLSTGLTRNVATSIGRFDMLVLQAHDNQPVGLTFLSDGIEAGWQSFLTDDAVFISEPIANKYQLSPGDTISLFTAMQGDTDFKIAGVLRDYGSSHGKLTLSRATFEKHWSDNTISSIGVIFKREVDGNQLLRDALADINQPLLIQANRRIHENSLAVFDRTFEVTRVLHWLTIGVAFVGVFSALLALHLERARELAVLRASGTTRLQLGILIGSQTAIMGLMAGLFAIPLGWIMSEILIHVINLRSFGWSMDSFIPDGAIPSTVLLSLVAALLAGLYPAWKLSRSHIASALRDE